MADPRYTRPGAPGASAQLAYQFRAGAGPDTRAWGIGAAGERKVGRALGRAGAAVVLHDRVWPGCRANLDHVVVARSGIFVVDTKAYSGRVGVGDRGRFLRPDLRLLVEGWDRSELVRAARDQAAAVARALRAARVAALAVPVVPVLCFVGSDWDVVARRGVAVLGGVVLTRPRGLVRLVRRRGPLDRPGVADLARRLDHLLPPKARRVT